MAMQHPSAGLGHLQSPSPPASSSVLWCIGPRSVEHSAVAQCGTMAERGNASTLSRCVVGPVAAAEIEYVAAVDVEAIVDGWLV